MWVSSHEPAIEKGKRALVTDGIARVRSDDEASKVVLDEPASGRAAKAGRDALGAVAGGDDADKRAEDVDPERGAVLAVLFPTRHGRRDAALGVGQLAVRLASVEDPVPALLAVIVATISVGSRDEGLDLDNGREGLHGVVRVSRG